MAAKAMLLPMGPLEFLILAGLAAGAIAVAVLVIRSFLK